MDPDTSVDVNRFRCSGRRTTNKVTATPSESFRKQKVKVCFHSKFYRLKFRIQIAKK
ncbi:hypothetical protein CCACVL1_30940 [Corchorus capsularis]|uniref:Uncharacterized protein n=1 Tax=Corchorus capsularis TaxID=210143 RepID=A0A1R3FUJ7_COCAP|nr:hypothetical protein CCACVL1_30940 [Corchorus capsularis]